MPVHSKIGSMLRDEPVLSELRELVTDDRAVGIPRARSLGTPAERTRLAHGTPHTIEKELSTEPVIESVVVLAGRPSLLVRGGTFEAPAMRMWRTRMQAAQSAMERVLPSVGRVELYDNDLGWLGTGWLIDERTVITNRHIAARFTRQRGRGFAIANDLTGRPLDVRVDFHEEFQGFAAPYEVSVKKILFVEADVSRADVAIMELARGAVLPDPVPLGGDPDVGQFVATIGYPAFDPDIPADVAQRVFGGVYNVKRLAPGQVMAGTADEPDWAFSHDCTTLGGNSGSLVTDLDTGSAVGLHFAGTYRTANYAVKVSTIKRLLTSRSVGFVTPPSASAPPIVEQRAAGEYRDRAGYDPGFLGTGKRLAVPLPGLGLHAEHVAVLKRHGGTELRYEHFSIVQHATRRLPLYTAVNIDGTSLIRVPRRDDRWSYDPRINKRAQVGDELYRNNDYDRGHMVRRLDPVWGTTAETANDDTFHWTNSTPQHHDLNTRTWNDLEDYILDNADAFRLRVTVLTGPVLDDNDPVYRAIKIPQEYWKIVAFQRADTLALSITAYLLSQAELDQPFAQEAPFVYGPFRTYQLPVRTVATRTGLDLGAYVTHDPLRRLESAGLGRRIDQLDQVTLR